MNPAVRFVATLGPAGHGPVAPATWGSLLVVVAGWFIPPPALPVALLLIGLGAGAAIWIAGEAEKELGHDAHPIVVDEAVGQSLALLFVPHTLAGFGAAFLLFRLFDIWKPLGAREAQALPGGIGIVADDAIAGLTACAAFHLGWWALRAMGLA